MRKSLCYMIIFWLAVTTLRDVEAAAISTDQIPGWPKAPEIVESTGVLMEDSTGTVLFDKGMHDRMYPASMTKVLSALIAIENSDLSEEVVFTETGAEAVTPDSANIGMQIGETLTMEQCLYAMLLASANEVSSQVAEHVAGSVEGFAQMMNEKAAELGCTDSHFVNANGWHDDEHYTSAYDMALILRAAIRNETFRKISGSQSYVIPPTNMNSEPRELGNHHAMLMPGPYHYEGVFAGKTGSTDEAGNTLVTACRKDDITLICTVMQSQEAAVVEDTAKLFDYGYGKFQKLQMTDPALTQEGGYAYVPAEASVSDVQSQDTPQGDLVASQYLYQGVPVGTALAAAPAPVSGAEAGTGVEGSLSDGQISSEDPAAEDRLLDIRPAAKEHKKVYHVIIGALSLLILLCLALIVRVIFRNKKI